MGVILISDDLPELLQNCDNLLLMKRGRIVRRFEVEACPRATSRTTWSPNKATNIENRAWMQAL
jgi:ABC-type sugar transport system ATPase subunit